MNRLLREIVDKERRKEWLDFIRPLEATFGHSMDAVEAKKALNPTAEDQEKARRLRAYLNLRALPGEYEFKCERRKHRVRVTGEGRVVFVSHNNTTALVPLLAESQLRHEEDKGCYRAARELLQRQAPGGLQRHGERRRSSEMAALANAGVPDDFIMHVLYPLILRRSTRRDRRYGYNNPVDPYSVPFIAKKKSNEVLYGNHQLGPRIDHLVHEYNSAFLQKCLRVVGRAREKMALSKDEEVVV